MATARNKKRPASSSSVSTSVPSLDVKTGLLECHSFLSPNEYSEHTFGLLAFLVRSSVGEINLSHIIDEAERLGQQGQAECYVTLLDEERKTLVSNGPAIEKCLMLNRFISYLTQNETKFIQRISNIRIDMELKMADHSTNQNITYPNDFRQREHDFNNRRIAQVMRRLFYHTHKEAREPPSVIHLQNRTTEHLSYIIDSKMRYDSKFRTEGLKELDRIFNSSFMIISQPHCGVNPVTTYDRKGPGEYVAKLSVTIVCLLHDFMVTHPNLIELYDIETSLWPLSPLYKLDESQTLSWKTCELQISRNHRPQKIQYAELSFIRIQQKNKSDTRVHFAQKMHTLKFAIELRVNLNEYRFSKNYKYELESLPFAIGNRNDQMPRLLTGIMLDDIRRLSKIELLDVKTIVKYLQRYFIHRTGVLPHDYLVVYLEEELNKAKNARTNFQAPEEFFTDFLTSFINQVEIMARHPVLAMLYADRCFLGTCNSEQVAEIMKQPSAINSPIFALRFNSIKIDYNAIATKSVVNRTIEPKPWAVRVDIYSHRTKNIINYTLNSTVLSNDLSQLLFTATTQGACRIRALSNSPTKINDAIYTFFNEFNKYYHIQLIEISKLDGPYKPLFNLIDAVNNEQSNGELNQNTNSNNLCSLCSYLTDSTSSMLTIDDDQNLNINDGSLSYASTSSNESLSQNVLLPSNQQENQRILEFVLSNPDIHADIVRRMNMVHLTNTTESISPPLNDQSHAQILDQNYQTQFQYGQQTEVSQAQIQQQQDVFSIINPCQPSELCSINDFNGTFQQPSTNVPMWQTSKTNLYFSTPNQMMGTNGQDTSQWFEERVR